MFSFGPIKTNKKRPDWVIIVNHNECNCLKLVAQKLSPKIRSFLKNNPEAKNFEINIGDCIIQRDLISSLFFGKEIQFSRSNIDMLLKLSTCLDISELYHNLLKYQEYIKGIENTVNTSHEISELLQIENQIFLLSTSTFESILLKLLKLITVQNEDTVVRIFLSFCIARHSKIELLINFLIIFNQKLNEIQNKQIQNNEIINKFCNLVLKEFFKEISHSGLQKFDEYRSILQELSFILFLLIEKKIQSQTDLIKNDDDKTIYPLFFAHLMTPEQIQRTQKMNSLYGDEKIPFFPPTSKTNENKQWIATHIYNAYLGMNTNPMIYALRHDKIEDFLKFSKTAQFKYDEKVPSCIYERCTFANEKPRLIEYAAFFGSVECFNYLVSVSQSKSPSLLRYAICSGNSDIIKTSADLNSTLLGTLSLSIEYHHQVISEWLIEVKDQPYNDQIAIQNCFRFCNFEMFSFLLKKGVNANFFLIEAVHYDILPAVHFLLQIKGIDINFQDNRKGYSPLHYACQNGNINIVKLLLNMSSINVNNRTIKTFFLFWHFNFFF